MNTSAVIVLIVAISQVGCIFAKNPTKTTHKFEPKMKFIKGGYVVINKNKPANLKNNKIKVNSFWIAETETTYKQWENCFKDGGCKKDKYLPNVVYNAETRAYYSNRPVTYVNWYEANEYTRWLSKISGKKYRLPTEAEWEYAARAGKETLYPWGNRLIGIEKCKVCNYNSGSSLVPALPVQPKPEDGYAPYGGLYYMYGNAAEWTCSPVSVDKSPSGMENICLTPATYSSGYIKTKGGSYEDDFNSEAYAHRPDGSLDFELSPSDGYVPWVGFRVIREE